MRTLVVEDIEAVRKEIVHTVQQYCAGVDIVGEAATVIEAAKLARSLSPDLILLDIELPDGTGFDLIELLDHAPRVIFITGAEAYAVKAFRFAAIDYLLKPVIPQELMEAVEKARRGMPLDREQVGVAVDSIRSSGTGGKIALSTADRIDIVEISSILYCASEGNYTHFKLLDGRSILVSRTLKDYDQLLSGRGFIRVHQSYLVNMDHAKTYIKHDGGYLILDSAEKVPVSTRKRQDVLEYLTALGGS